jgi:FkbM family methyltransferase
MKDTIENLRESKVYIYGTGSFGRDILELCRQLELNVESFVDHAPKPHISVKKCVGVEDLPTQKDITVILGVCNLFGDLQKISTLILSRNPQAKILTPVHFAKICAAKGLELENYWLTGNTTYLSDRNREIEDLKQLLGDDQSRDLVNQIVKYRIDGFVEDIPTPERLEDQYLPSELPTPPNSLNMLELGSFKGEDLKRFISRSKEINFAFCLEPDFENYRELVLQVKELNVPNVFPLPIGAWEVTSQLKFASNGQTGAQLNEFAENSVLVMKLDDLVGSSFINYVKMDIEGAEIQAIEGLKNTIFMQIPHLAISVYHKPADLWEIPFKINQIAPDAYSFFLRVYGHQTFDTVLYCVPKV